MSTYFLESITDFCYPSEELFIKIFQNRTKEKVGAKFMVLECKKLCLSNLFNNYLDAKYSLIRV